MLSVSKAMGACVGPRLFWENYPSVTKQVCDGAVGGRRRGEGKSGASPVRQELCHLRRQREDMPRALSRQLLSERGPCFRAGSQTPWEGTPVLGNRPEAGESEERTNGRKWGSQTEGAVAPSPAPAAGRLSHPLHLSAAGSG